jgi:hypothetical protein
MPRPFRACPRRSVLNRRERVRFQTALTAVAPAAILHGYARPGIASFWFVFRISAAVDLAGMLFASGLWRLAAVLIGDERPSVARRVVRFLVVAVGSFAISASIFASLVLPTVTICAPAPDGGLWA